MSPEDKGSRPFLCVTDGHRMSWLGGDLIEPLSMPMAVWAAPDAEGGVVFELQQPEASDAVHIEALGTQLAVWSDTDLLAVVLGGFFERLVSELPEELVRGQRQGPDGPEAWTAGQPAVPLVYPAWMGPRERSRLFRAASTAGLRLRDGIERGFVPVLARAAQGGAPPEIGGFVVADACGSDLDFYSVADTSEDERRTVELLSYHRCRQVLSPYYEQREVERCRVVEQTLAKLPAGWPLLVTSEAVGKLARKAAGTGEGAVEDPQILTFSHYLTSMKTPEALEDVRILRRWRYWFDHGDARLTPVSRGDEVFPWRGEHLFVVPAEVPPKLTLALCAGFTPVRAEAHELCRLALSKPDFYTAPGHLLVTVELTGSERGQLGVELLQHGRSIVRRDITFPAGAEES